MNRKNIFIFLIIMLIPVTVNATGGGLRNRSIKTCPDGVTYGMHSDGHGGTHWHVAVTNGDNYYASGEAIYSDPCPDSTTNRGTAGSTSGGSSYSSGNSDYNETSNYSTNSETTSTPVEPVVKEKSNDTSIKSIYIDDEKIETIKDEMDYETTNKKINILVSTTDSKAKTEINGNKDNLIVGEISQIEIIVIAENGTRKSYKINVKRNEGINNISIINFKINDDEITFDSDKKGTTFVYYWTKSFNYSYELSEKNAKLIIIKNGKEIKNKKLKKGFNKYEIQIIDKNDNINSYYLEIERMSKGGSILLIIITTVLLLIIPISSIIIVIIVLKNNKKKKKQGSKEKKEEQFVEEPTEEIKEKIIEDVVLDHKHCPVCNIRLNNSNKSNGLFNDYYICKNCIRKIKNYSGGENPIEHIYLEDLKKIVNYSDE